MAETEKTKAKKESAAATFDMAAMETSTMANDGVWLTLLDPMTFEESNVRIKLLGYDSDIYTAWNVQKQAMVKQAMLQAMADARKHKSLDNEALKAISDDASDFKGIARLVVAWENVVWEGKELSCTQENVLKILQQVPQVRQQILNFVDDRANFCKGASTNS